MARSSKLIRMLEDVCDLLRAPFFQLLLLLYFLNICFVFHQIRDVERCVCLVQSLLLTALQTGIKWPMSFFGSSACCQRIYILQICNYPATVRKIYFECSMFSNMLSNNLLWESTKLLSKNICPIYIGLFFSFDHAFTLFWGLLFKTNMTWFEMMKTNLTRVFVYLAENQTEYKSHDN